MKLDGQKITLKQLAAVARELEPVSLTEAVKTRILNAEAMVASIVLKGSVVYGINTGFGKLAEVTLEADALSQLQINLLRSHACGCGKPLSKEVVRAMLLLRVNALIQGHSGTRLVTIEKMLEFLNKNAIPVVYEKGSLGASGDLVPLAHMALALGNEGEMWLEDEIVPTHEALKAYNITPLDTLSAKEGLSLINGTQAMLAVGALTLIDTLDLMRVASFSAGLTFEALRGIKDALDPRIHALRNQAGQIKVATEVLSLIADSKNVTTQGQLRVQDAYSLRCVPQVHGAVYDALMYVQDKVEREMNAVTDNPILFLDTDEVISAGNFHGEPLAIPFDTLGIALSELANIAERRIERLVNPQLNNGLPAFLAAKPGLNSGFMIVQYTAASLVSENKVLSHPASVDSIPSSANQEDHVSMGTISALKAAQILENVKDVLAIELMTAYQALHFDRLDQVSSKNQKILSTMKPYFAFHKADALMHPYIKQSRAWMEHKETKALLEVILCD